MDPAVYLRLATPLVLAAPVLRLLPPPVEPEAELPGIRPITIRIVTPRRTFILLTLTLLAISATLDAARLITEIATSSARERIMYGLPLWSEVVYAFGGLCVWALTAIFIEWRAKWGDRNLVILGVLGILLEVPNLVLAVLRQTHDNDIFHILAIPPPALRLLLLPLLVILVSRPIIRYEAAETSRLLPEGSTEYGTFEGDQPKLSIPKKLGEIKKEDKPLTWREIWQRLKKLSPHLWPSTSRKLQLYVVLCMICILVGRVASPIQPIILGRVVNQLIAAQNGLPARPLIPFAEYIGVRLSLGSSGVLTFINNVLWVRVAQYTDREMQMLCFNHLLNLSLAYHTKRNTGEVLKIIDRGSAINNLFQTVLFTAIPTVLDIIISFGVFYFLFGPVLACVTFLVMCTYVVFSVTQTNWRMRLRRVMVNKDIKTRGIVSDVLTNWESVKYFTAEDRESNRFRESIVSYQETEAKVQIGFNLLFFIQYFLLTLGLALGALIVAFRVINGQADAASFIVFTQYYAQLQGPLNNFGYLYRIFNQETTDAEKMFTLLAETTEVNDKPDAKELVVTDGVIEFDNVTFSYDGKVDALRGVSFRLGKGESLALVGESGSGKSTILRLLYRFYDITSGRILIDGQDISQVTQLSLRRAIGIVPQDSVLWNDTIGANISYGKEGSNDEAIIAAAQAARLHERILGFPEQYETVVGERGVRLSGGEKQRVSLARMFLKSPAILVLDEATSALDTETEREIQRALADLAKGRSSLSIAHRLSTIINSDHIVVMKDGQVIELGGYKQLLEKDGIFAMMWKKQIFTDAEILAQSGMNSAARSGETTPKPSAAASPRGSIKGKEVSRGVEEANDVTPDEPTAVQPGSAKDASTDEVVTAGDELDQPVSAQPTISINEDATKVVEGSDDLAEATASADNALGLKEGPAEGQGEEQGFVVEPETYADPVKHSEPDEAQSPATVTPAPASAPLAQEERTPAAESTEARPSPIRTPSGKAVPFPPLPRMSSSISQRSGLSNASGGENGAPSTPGSNEPELGDKRRKRLSSLKGFVRRISDQGVTRSNSFKNFMSGDSPRASPAPLDETTPLVGSPAAQSPPSPVAATVPATALATGAQGQGKKKNKKKGRK